MTSVQSKLYADDVSLVVVLLDANPFFWATSSISFSQFLSHVLAFLNSILLLNQLNQVVIIATGHNSCDCIYDSSSPPQTHSSENGALPALYAHLLQRLEEYSEGFPIRATPSTAPSEYVAIMNAIFSAQRSMVPIDSCYVGAHNSAFLQQASHITGGVYVKPQHTDGLFQYLVTVFATDLHSRSFLQLPRPAGVDFRASSVFGQAQGDASSAADRKRKAPET
ncbi:hypothetical protein Tsubulata_020483 [Turnera subulata]|uniref:General transcription and DNA repair factor IIH subunit TFB4 n=1 Tax=Turnera subulata TaxID=218843 RepID=A0A9Q0F6B6_9ROSI|nr:hypothetical protein Tsubulata_020483 [Turnera subulata]